MQSAHQEPQEIYTVSQLNSDVRLLLEGSFPFVWVEGEISNFAAPQSGHWYFSLKDATAQVRCAMFRGHQRKLAFIPKDGMHILIKARVSLYENRGEFQLIAEEMEERGEGKLRRAFELLKKKLESAGLFDPQHKKTLPLFPKQIGIVTSSTGAALRDILIVLKRRFPCVNIIIYPTLVQGKEAAPNIVKAIQTANHRLECDVIIVARGGGSLEDLWPFNEEIVANAIYQSHIPIITGIGHEIDFTIADFVADKRAPTPSAAAEIAVPNRLDILNSLLRQQQQVLRLIHNKLATIKQQIVWTKKHLYKEHPKRRLNEKMQQLDFYEATLIQQQKRFVHQLQTKLKELTANLFQHLPQHRINHLRQRQHLAEQKLVTAMYSYLQRQKMQLAEAAGKLNALSPLATLERGFAIVSKDQQVIRYASEVKVGDDISIRLMQGSLDCKVKAASSEL